MPDRLSSDRDQVLDDSIERRHCQRQMTLIAVQVHPCIRNVFRQPLSVREGHHPILLALPHRHRSIDLREVESPVAHKRQIVVTPTRDAVRDGVPEGGACGPPPDQPIVTNSSAPSSPRIASTSLTASAIECPCFAVDVP